MVVKRMGPSALVYVVEVVVVVVVVYVVVIVVIIPTLAAPTPAGLLLDVGAASVPPEEVATLLSASENEVAMVGWLLVRATILFMVAAAVARKGDRFPVDDGVSTDVVGDRGRDIDDDVDDNAKDAPICIDGALLLLLLFPKLLLVEAAAIVDVLVVTDAI